MAEFQIDTFKLRETGNDIIKLTNELNEIFNSLFTKINNMPVTTKEWTGNASLEFVRKINIERKYYNAFKDNLCKYGRLLINTSDKLESDAKKGIL